jgi:predicted nucleic acid-binding protein
MILTFVDAGVLIAAARGANEQARRAMVILDDPNCLFAASSFLRLEVLPQAAFNRRAAETAFYEAFFASVTIWATDLAAVVAAVESEASTYGVEAMDALHVAAAANVNAAELITTEKPTRAIHRARSVNARAGGGGGTSRPIRACSTSSMFAMDPGDG